MNLPGFGVVLFGMGAPRTAIGMFAYAGVTAVTLPLFAKTRQFGWYRALQLALLNFAPALYTILMGGVLSSGLLRIWTMWTPVVALAEAHGVEKLRTIGDAYMAVAGAPIARPDHAQAAADLALAMARVVRDTRERIGLAVDFRIGMNSGPVIGAVIGTSRFHYDIWGDAVNIAARMESHGEAGAIQISDRTRELLGEQYECAPRGEVDVKGKGPMTAWLLVARVEAASP